MRRIFICLLFGFLFRLLLFENSIALHASENIQDSFKSANYLVGYASVPMGFYQNGTERHPNLIFIIIDSFKSTNYLGDYASVPMIFYQNGTERHPNLIFISQPEI